MIAPADNRGDGGGREAIGDTSKRYSKPPSRNWVATASLWFWVAGYVLEEARQSHEAHGRHFRRLACCIALAALRLLTGGLHHV